MMGAPDSPWGPSGALVGTNGEDRRHDAAARVRDLDGPDLARLVGMRAGVELVRRIGHRFAQRRPSDRDADRFPGRCGRATNGRSNVGHHLDLDFTCPGRVVDRDGGRSRTDRESPSHVKWRDDIRADVPLVALLERELRRPDPEGAPVDGHHPARVTQIASSGDVEPRLDRRRARDEEGRDLGFGRKGTRRSHDESPPLAIGYWRSLTGISVSQSTIETVLYSSSVTNSKSTGCSFVIGSPIGGGV